MIEFKIGLLVGSQTGNAMLVAQLIADHTAKWGMRTHILNATDAAVTDYADLDGVLVCTSSHGNGELPDNLVASYQWLIDNKPDLSHLGYAVIALGDTTYSATYCGAGNTMDQIMSSLGAHRVQDHLRIDASIQPFPDDDAIRWLEQWVPLERLRQENIRARRK